MTQPLNVDLWTSVEQLRAHGALWDDLWQRSATVSPAARAEPLAVWCDHFAKAGQFRAIVVNDGITGYELWKVEHAIRGDVDLDGDVDFHDFINLQIGFGIMSDAQRGDGDLDGDGDFDFDDILPFVNLLNTGRIASVPEPGTFALSLLFVLCLVNKQWWTASRRLA